MQPVSLTLIQILLLPYKSRKNNSNKCVEQPAEFLVFHATCVVDDDDLSYVT